ncbi:MAG TPA: ESPR-type extended signal peptide-containing protein, partial [Stenotrophomonas sp.]
MNKIYRLVWSRKEQALVVASEFAKSDSAGKTKTVQVGRTGGLVLAGAMAMFSATAWAGSLDEGVAAGSTNIAIGTGSQATNGSSGIGQTAIAIGTGATASNANGALAIGAATADGRGAIAIGMDGSFHARALASADDTVAIGNNTKASGQADSAFGVSAKATGSMSTALGVGAESQAFQSVALGRDAEGTAASSTALGSLALANHVDSVALGANSATAAAVGTASGDIAGTSYNYAGTAPGSTVSVGTVGNERTITNVAAGRVSTTSTDAVNGSQLNATNTEVSALDKRVDKQGADTAAGLGGGATYNPATGGVSKPTYNINGDIYNDAGSAMDGIVNGGKGIKYFRARSTKADASATGLDSVAVGPLATASAANSVAVGNGATAGQAGAVALGAASTTSAAVGTASGTIAGTTYSFAGTAPGSTVSVGAAGAERTVTNVAAGRLGATSTDAINGSQLNATNQAVDQLDNRVTNVDDRVTNVDNRVTTVDGRVTNVDSRVTNLGDQITNGTIGLVQQDPATRAITVAKDTNGKQVNFTGTAGDRVLAGVDKGKADNDAVNVSQLKKVTDSLGGGTTVNPDGSITGPTYIVEGDTYNNVGDAITAVDGRVTNVDNRVTNLGDQISNGTIGLVQQDPTSRAITVAKDTDGKQVDLTG